MVKAMRLGINMDSMTNLPSGLAYQDIVVGEGAEAVIGKAAVVHYTGWLQDGTKFDSSVGGTPFTFNVGGGQVIQGWDEGVPGMKVGGKRKLVLPSELGYGKNGAPPDIPPNATLVFEVELLEVR
jgi:FKBP-type peptidyl-prolyl cis-trans isomerase